MQDVAVEEDDVAGTSWTRHFRISLRNSGQLILFHVIDRRCGVVKCTVQWVAQRGCIRFRLGDIWARFGTRLGTTDIRSPQWLQSRPSTPLSGVFGQRGDVVRVLVIALPWLPRLLEKHHALQGENIWTVELLDDIKNTRMQQKPLVKWMHPMRIMYPVEGANSLCFRHGIVDPRKARPSVFPDMTLSMCSLISWMSDSVNSFSIFKKPFSRMLR